MQHKRKNAIINDHEWLRKNIGKLVDKHGGKFLVIAENEPFIGDDAKQLVKKAKAKYPKTTLTSMPIPRPEDFTCAL